MSGVLRATIALIALLVLGIVFLQLSGGTDRAAQDSARCLDPRQPGCESGQAHPAAGLGRLSGGDWKRPGAPRAPREAQPVRSVGSFSVPQAAELRLTGPSAAAGDAAGASTTALDVALQDLARALPRDLQQRHSRGVPGDPEASVVEYGRGGEVLFRLVSGRGGVFATDYDRGLRYELDRDGALRREGALVDAAEAPARRARRLTERWGAFPDAARALGRDPQAAAAFIDLRRTGLPPQAAARWARESQEKLPPYAAWQQGAAAELGSLDEDVLRSFYSFLGEVPVLSRLAAAALGEPPLQIARRFGFQGHLLRSFLEGATSDDLQLARRLPEGALPQGSRSAPRRSLHELVGDPFRTALLPLCVASLEEALTRPEEVLRASGLPSTYPYLLLREEDGERPRPLLVSAATLRSWSKPLSPAAPEALLRLGALAPDAPVALEAPLSGPMLAALGLLRDGREAQEARLLAFALAGPLRDRLAEERRPLSRLQGLFADPAERPPASYYGQAPFLYGAVRAGDRLLGRHGIPTGALLMLQAEQAGLKALPATFPEGAPARLTGALEALAGAYQRASASFGRLRRTLLLGSAGRAVVERWDLIETQVALVGLAAGCHGGGRCPLPGLRRPADGELLLGTLRRGIAALRPRVYTGALGRADAAELTDRLGELLLNVDRVSVALAPERRLRPRTRDPAVLARMAAYVEAMTGEAPRPDPAYDGGLLVRDLDSAAYRERLAAWERGVAPRDLDGEILRARRDRGEVPATLGELVQRYGAALQEARLEHLPAGQARDRRDRRVRQRLWAGPGRLSIVQTLDASGALRDVEVLLEQPGGALEPLRYDGDGRLVVEAGKGPLQPAGAACLGCHSDRGRPILSPPARWQAGAGGVTWLTPVAAAELDRTARDRRAAELR